MFNGGASYTARKTEFYFFLCSEQTVGNRGTQSYGTKRTGSMARVGARGNHEQRTRITDTALMSAAPPEKVFLAVFYLHDKRHRGGKHEEQLWIVNRLGIGDSTCFLQYP